MFTYIFDGVGADIKTPGVSDFSEIRTEILEQTTNHVRFRSYYPSGLILEVDQEDAKTTVYSNRPLVQNPDGSYTAPEP